MFIGHFAVGLAAKKAAPKVSLGTLFIATQLVDLLWPVFMLMGLEHVRIAPGITAVTPLDFYDYPITHSLIGAIGWSLVLAAIYYAIRRELKSSMVIALGVFSHWILDFLTHRPDLPLGFGTGTYFGLGLWNSVAGTMVVECALFVVYLKTTIASDRIGSYGFWGLVGFLFVMYIANFFGPPPPSESAIAVAGNAMWLFVLWGYWVDRHRKVRAEESNETKSGLAK